MKKFIALFLLVATVASLGSCNGYLFIGAGWQDTPEAALRVAAEDEPFKPELLRVSVLLDTWSVDDQTYMFFLSEGDTLVEAEFVTNRRGQFHHRGWADWGTPGDPEGSVLNGDENQILGYGQYGSQVWGYKYSNLAITVNGIVPQTKTYVFICRGKEWSIDRFWVDGIEEDAEVNIEYISE